MAGSKLKATASGSKAARKSGKQAQIAGPSRAPARRDLEDEDLDSEDDGEQPNNELRELMARLVDEGGDDDDLEEDGSGFDEEEDGMVEDKEDGEGMEEDGDEFDEAPAMLGDDGAAEIEFDDEEGEPSDDEDEDAPALNSDYLPDHLFATASRAKKPQPQAPTKASLKAGAKPAKARKRARKTGKDTVIGTHAVRKLPAVHRTSAGTGAAAYYTAAASATTPSGRVNKFLKKSLALSGKKKPGQGWERKPAGLGVLRRGDGAPVTGFARRQG